MTIRLVGLAGCEGAEGGRDCPHHHRPKILRLYVESSPRGLNGV